MSHKSISQKHVVSIRDLTKEDITVILDLAEEMKKKPGKYSDSLRGRILSLAFFEPSTRTNFSFESAMMRLGGRTMGFSSVGATSVKKGERLHDTLRMLEAYSDAVVIRHPKRGTGVFAKQIMSVPVISGGTGSQEHPTQALLDIFTVREALGKLSGLKIGLMGDLRYSRTIPSLLYSFAKFGKSKIFSFSHDLLRIPNSLKYDISQTDLELIESEDFEKHLPDLDLIYITRIQRERFPDPELFHRVQGKYIFYPKYLKLVKPEFLILHPLPRIHEIPLEIDKAPQAKYFIQAKNGVYVRMAILYLLLGGNEQ